MNSDVHEKAYAVYAPFIGLLLACGHDPNTITRRVQETLHQEATDWALFGDGIWRHNTVCSICGSWVAGICGHQDIPGRKVLLRSEYDRLKSGISEVSEP